MIAGQITERKANLHKYKIFQPYNKFESFFSLTALLQKIKIAKYSKKSISM